MVASSTSLNKKTASIGAGVQVRSVNEIYKCLGLDSIQKVRDHQCKVEFNPTVFSRPPAPDEIYKKALVEGTLNKQSKEEIRQAVERAEEAYRIATTSLFKDISSYSFDSYKRDLANPVGLKDLEAFTLTS